MGYYDKFGITKIKDTKMDNLSISWDYDFNPDRIYPVFLFTPDMNNTNEHFHISLTKTEAKKLKAWLDAYLEDK